MKLFILLNNNIFEYWTIMLYDKSWQDSFIIFYSNFSTSSTFSPSFLLLLLRLTFLHSCLSPRVCISISFSVFCFLNFTFISILSTNILDFYDSLHTLFFSEYFIQSIQLNFILLYYITFFFFFLGADTHQKIKFGLSHNSYVFNVIRILVETVTTIQYPQHPSTHNWILRSRLWVRLLCGHLNRQIYMILNHSILRLTPASGESQSDEVILPSHCLLFRASTDSMISILSYLSVVNICRLDTAVTNRAIRVIWLSVLQIGRASCRERVLMSV